MYLASLGLILSQGVCVVCVYVSVSEAGAGGVSVCLIFPCTHKLATLSLPSPFPVVLHEVTQETGEPKHSGKFPGMPEQ